MSSGFFGLKKDMELGMKMGGGRGWGGGGVKCTPNIVKCSKEKLYGICKLFYIRRASPISRVCIAAL
jgi:hypothetical protein